MISWPLSGIWRLDDFLAGGAVPAGDLKSCLAAIDGPAIVFPGLVNSHDHFEFNLYDPMPGRTFDDVVSWTKSVHDEMAETIARVEAVPFELRWQWGALKNLLSGVTWAVDHAPDREVPKPAWPRLIGGFDFYHSPETEPSSARLMRFWDRRPIVAHLAEGKSPRVHAGARRFLRRNVFGRKIIAVHGIGLEGPELAQLAALIWCPASNIHLYGATADLSAAPDGLAVLFGTDSSLSAPGSIWDHIRQARTLKLLDDTALLAALMDTPYRVWPINRADRAYVVARARTDHPLEAFFRVEPPDILAIIDGQQPILWDRDLEALGTGGTAIGLGETVKYVPGELGPVAAGLRDHGFRLTVGGHRVEGPR